MEILRMHKCLFCSDNAWLARSIFTHSRTYM